MTKYCFFAVLTVICVATRPAEAQTTSYHLGNSLTQDALTPAFSRFSDQRGQDHAAGQHISQGRSLPFILNYPDDPGVSEGGGFGKWDEALNTQKWDVVTLQIYPSFYPDPAGSGANLHSNLDTDTAAIKSLIDYTRQNPDNAQTRFVIYAPWARTDTAGGDYSAAWTQPLVEQDGVIKTSLTRNYFQAVYDRAITENPGVDMGMLMTGELFYQMDQKIKEEVAQGGDWLGFTDIDELYRDANHLSQDAGRWVASTAMWGAVTGEDPAELIKPSDEAGRWMFMNKNEPGYALNPRDDSESLLVVNTALRDGLTGFVSDALPSIYQSVPEPSAGGVLACTSLMALIWRGGVGNAKRRCFMPEDATR